MLGVLSTLAAVAAAPQFWNVSHSGATLDDGTLDYYSVLPEIGAGMVRLQFSWTDVESSKPAPDLACGVGETRTGPDSRGNFHCYRWDGAQSGDAGLETQLRHLARLKVDTVVLVDPITIIDANRGTVEQCQSWRCSVIKPLKYAYALEPEQRANWLFFIRSAVRHFAASNRYWSAWNEIDFTDQCAACRPYLEPVTDLVRDTMRTIKEADPRAVTVMGGLSKPRREAPVFFQRLADKADPWINVYDVHQYTMSTGQKGLRDDFAAQIAGWNSMLTYPAASKIRWITEMGGPKSDGDRTAEDFDDHDFLLVKNWLKIYLWYAETTHKPSRPERIFWFRLCDKPSLPRRTNKQNGFVYRSAAWDRNPPRDFERKQFFIDSAHFWSQVMRDFAKVDALCAPQDALQLFRVTRADGALAWIAWNEGDEPLTLSRDRIGRVRRVRRAAVVHHGFRNISFAMTEQPGVDTILLAPESRSREGNMILFESRR